VGKRIIMAQAPGHKFGQIIGENLELAIKTPLKIIAKEYNLYLDYKHRRLARGNKSNVNWRDDKGNVHDLDYVLEEGGTEKEIGKPKAFIEIAWRRYTKHSRNKAQEIQGAIAPLAQTYSSNHPFLGVVLGGVFTKGSLTQLESYGFNVLFYPYDMIAKAFKSVGIDIIFDEDTEDEVLQQKIDSYEALSESQKVKICNKLRSLNKNAFQNFMDSLKIFLERKVESVFVLPLYGTSHKLSSIQEAMIFLDNYKEIHTTRQFVRFEVNVRYSNGDDIRGVFRDKTKAIEFLSLL
jgi:hypothetical protein